jgi:hypothetical protein
MKRVQGTVTTAFLISAALVSALAGCSISVTPLSTDPSTPAETEPSAVAESPSPDTEPEPEPEPASLTIGGCDDLFTREQAKSLLGRTAVLFEENPANEYRTWFEVPALRSEISGLTGGVSCWWGIPNSDYSVVLMVVKIDPATRASIEATLETEGYTSVVTRTIAAYGMAPEDAYRAESHLFTGDLWILSDGPAESMTSTVSESALEALRAANPSLGL